MTYLRGLLSILILIPMLGLAATPAGALEIGQKVRLQAAMQQHIDRQTIGGVFVYLNPNTGKVQSLYPATAHTVIVRMGKIFVLCFDFRTTQGKKALVDFYLARKSDTFVVIHTSINDRHRLRRWMRQGLAVRAD